MFYLGKTNIESIYMTCQDDALSMWMIWWDHYFITQWGWNNVWGWVHQQWRKESLYCNQHSRQSCWRTTAFGAWQTWYAIYRHTLLLSQHGYDNTTFNWAATKLSSALHFWSRLKTSVHSLLYRPNWPIVRNIGWTLSNIDMAMNDMIMGGE